MNRPGGELSKRPLHFFWIADCSGSMAGDKIQSLNYAIKSCIKPMRDIANSDQGSQAEVLVRAIRFSNGAQWIDPTPVPVSQWNWTDLTADGQTDMGKAISMVAQELDVSRMPDRGLPPVLVLITDGQPSDDFNIGLKMLNDKPWGRKAVRVAIAIGHDADTDELQKFLGNNEVKPLQANNAEQLVTYIRWASTAVLGSVARPATRTVNANGEPASANIPIPTTPVLSDTDDIW